MGHRPAVAGAAGTGDSTSLPRRLLIANRGEIAVRVIAACRELGIEAVAIYSDADADSLHVRMADLAVPIGGVTGAESYLRIDSVIGAARQSGATAIHPGYGFLSENPAFAEACAAAGILFIGPPPEAMRLLGNKISAKGVAEMAGVPVVPGYRGEDQSLGTLRREAARIGYPVLVKAGAGGGGRGMRVVREAAALPDAVEAAAREASAAFGDGSLFLERYLARPRHVEVQVLADRHGTVIHLGERECSVQRRHQKVIEEAPSPVVDEPLRAALGEAAVRLARTAAYVNAGTVEFLLDDERRFYFLEMNTRLQVEHPVTELVNGIDLVAAQIRIAAGEPIPRDWRALRPRGHAIEARIYAEDPARGFVPAAGTVLRLDLPHLPGVRIDAGVATGDTVGVHFDPLLAKVIAHGETRHAALARLRDALAGSAVLGPTTNITYLRAILAHPAFAAGDLSTRFLEEHEADLLRRPPVAGDWLWAAAALACNRVSEDGVIWRSLGPWRHRAAGMLLALRQGDEVRRVVLMPEDGHWWRPAPDAAGQAAAVRLRAGARDGEIVVEDAERRQVLAAERTGDTVYLAAAGAEYRFQLAEPPAAGGGKRGVGSAGLEAPMPGVLVKVQVREGERVAAHQPLVVLEAMKMEHVIAAPSPGVVRRLPFAAGALVPAGATVVELEAE